MLVGRGVRVTELRVQRRTLEDSVLELTGPSTDRVERASQRAPASEERSE
jgi:hypothetical protein